MDKRILIVDDEAPIRMLIEQTLQELSDEGVIVDVVTNGLEGLNYIQEHKPQVVFLDVMMPKMNGFDVCSTVKKDPELADVYICILTAKGQEFDKEKGNEVGADTYMTKPFDPFDLLELAEDILNL